MGVSDTLRKVASTITDPFSVNIIFQLGAFSAGALYFLLFSLRPGGDINRNIVRFVGGFLIATFTFLFLKAIATGLSVSTVVPFLRIGGVALVALLGIIFYKEGLTFNKILGLILSFAGLYLLSGK